MSDPHSSCAFNDPISLRYTAMPMDRRLLRILLGQLQFQCHVVLVASQDVDIGVKARNSMNVFVHPQGLLSAAASISRVCWGQGGKRAAVQSRYTGDERITRRLPFEMSRHEITSSTLTSASKMCGGPTRRRINLPSCRSVLLA